MKAQHKRKKLEAPLHVSAVLDAVLSGLGADSEQVRISQLWKKWGLVMGAELASLAVPLGARKNILLVGARDSITLQELHMHYEELLERANAFMESPFFTDIHLGLHFGKALQPTSVPPKRKYTNKITW